MTGSYGVRVEHAPGGDEAEVGGSRERRDLDVGVEVDPAGQGVAAVEVEVLDVDEGAEVLLAGHVGAHAEELADVHVLELGDVGQAPGGLEVHELVGVGDAATDDRDVDGLRWPTVPAARPARSTKLLTRKATSATSPSVGLPSASRAAHAGLEVSIAGVELDPLEGLGRAVDGAEADVGGDALEIEMGMHGRGEQAEVGHFDAR